MIFVLYKTLKHVLYIYDDENNFHAMFSSRMFLIDYYNNWYSFDIVANRKMFYMAVHQLPYVYILLGVLMAKFKTILTEVYYFLKKKQPHKHLEMIEKTLKV